MSDERRWVGRVFFFSFVLFVVLFFALFLSIPHCSLSLSLSVFVWCVPASVFFLFVFFFIFLSALWPIHSSSFFCALFSRLVSSGPAPISFASINQWPTSSLTTSPSQRARCCSLHSTEEKPKKGPEHISEHSVQHKTQSNQRESSHSYVNQ